MSNKLVSIIIVNFNGKKWLQKCLNSLAKQTYKNVEIIFVDNCSTDESVSFVKNTFPKVKIVQSNQNNGFAGGNNLGYRESKGEYILLLNNDTHVNSDFVEKFMLAFEKIPNLGVAQSRILLMDKPEIIDSCGSYWTDSSFLYYVGNSKSSRLDMYKKPFQVFSTKGASNLIKREVIEEIGLFDEDFWSYYEETDFCNRVWMAGYECWYWPQTEVYHALGGTSLTFQNNFVQFHNFKNKLSSFIKNFEVKTLIVTLPQFFILNLGLSIVWLLMGKFSHVGALYKAIWWNIVNLPNILEKRSHIQSLRKLSDKKIFKKVKRNPRISYYLTLFTSHFENYKD